MAMIRVLKYLCVFAVGAWATGGTLTGAGTSADPYKISDYEDLKAMQTYGLNKYYALTNDIDASPSRAEVNGWVPLGTFTGQFDGKDFAIRNLYVRKPVGGAGLFSILIGTARDLKILNAEIIAQSGDAGILAGYAGKLSGGNSGGTAYRVHVTGRVQGTNYVGGLVGTAYQFSIRRSSVVADIFSTRVAGGLTAEVRFVNANSQVNQISENFTAGSVFGAVGAGGLSGMMQSTYSTGVFNNYSLCTVYGASQGIHVADFGGLIGRISGDALLTKAWVFGRVTDQNGGGVWGTDMGTSNGSDASSVFWNTEKAERPYAAGYSSYLHVGPIGPPSFTLAVMKLQATYTGWDMTNVWKIKEGLAFPGLIWQNNPPVAMPDVWANSPVPLDTLTQAQINLLVANDFDLDTGTVVLTARIRREAKRIAGTSNQRVYYQVGEVLASGDTLWGGESYVQIPIQTVIINSYSALRKIGGNNFYTLGNNYELGQDIDASASANAQSAFTPIGTYLKPFLGSFDGKGFTISNLTINRPYEHYIGLFGAASRSLIKNLTLRKATINGYSHVGALLAVSDSCTVDNVHATGVLSANNIAGGLIAWHYLGSVIKSSAHMQMTVAGAYAGGFMGYAKELSHINNNFSTSNVSGISRVGGFVGESRESSLTYNYATGSVKGDSLVGGFAGVVNQGTLVDSYSLSWVQGALQAVGGLVGHALNATIGRSYVAGQVSGLATEIGALEGRNTTSTISSCYWDSTISMQQTGTGQGLKTSLAKKEASYVGMTFSFTSTGNWGILADKTYPAIEPVSNNAPFAFADTVTGQFNLMLLNDWDFEHPTDQSLLTMRIDSTKALTVFQDPGDSLWVWYQVGEVRAQDTLWGGRTRSIFVATEHAPQLKVTSLTTQEDMALVASLSSLFEDLESDPIEVTIEQNAKNGTFTLTDSARYNPVSNYNGLDSVILKLSDGFMDRLVTLKITVQLVDDPTKFVLDTLRISAIEDIELKYKFNNLFTDVDTRGTSTLSVLKEPKHGTARLVLKDSLIYMPSANYNGSDTLSLLLNDSDRLDTMIVIITIAAREETPVVRDTIFQLEIGECATLHASSYTTPNYTAQAIFWEGSVTHGAFRPTLQISFQYCPTDVTFQGIDSLSFWVINAHGVQSNKAKIYYYIEVEAPTVLNKVDRLNSIWTLNPSLFDLKGRQLK